MIAQIRSVSLIKELDPSERGKDENNQDINEVLKAPLLEPPGLQDE
jgi:hypothetical protein